VFFSPFYAPFSASTSFDLPLFRLSRGISRLFQSPIIEKKNLAVQDTSSATGRYHGHMKVRKTESLMKAGKNKVHAGATEDKTGG
jgi:hypothetical protein